MSALWTAGGAIVGALAGSFLATLAIRWPRGQSIARGRSRCDGCAMTLPPHALVPLASFLILRGRCRACGRAINARQPAMELLCALIGGLAMWVRPDAAGLAGALFGWMLATLALLDFDHLWLPDALVLPLGAGGLTGGLYGLAPTLPDRVIGAAAGYLAFALTAGAYRSVRKRVGLGQGDVKLAAAIGAWLGYRALPWVVLGAACLGLGACVLALPMGRKVTLADRMPLGALLAIAAWPAWIASQGL